MTIDVQKSSSLTQNVPDKPVLFLVQGRYQNWIKPVMILEYLGIDWQPVVLSDPDSGTDWYGTIHPYKYLPALIDNVDGERTVLWDSSTILAYLGERYDLKRGLVGRTMKEKLEIQNWLIFETANLGMLGDLKRQYNILNHRLSQPGQDWLGLKDRPTIADLSVYPFADETTLNRMELNVAQWPALKNWRERMAQLPFVAKAYAEMDSRETAVID